MIKCEHCGREFKNLGAITKHLKYFKVNLEEYYLKHVQPNARTTCIQCGKKTKFTGLSHGYEKYCHNPCPTKRLYRETKRGDFPKKVWS